MALVIAHRGSGPLGPEPENTTAAFLAAARLGADGVEIDVRRTADRQLVVSHDAELPNGELICEIPASGLPSEMPSLAEALEACDGMFVNVEVKNAKVDPDFDPSQWVARAAATLLVERSLREGGEARVAVSSFSRRAVHAVQSTAPTLETAWLVGVNLRNLDVLTIAAADGIEGVHPYDTLVDARLVDAAHAAGLAVRVWAVDDLKRAAELVRLGVDAVITDDVGGVRATLDVVELAKKRGGREQSGA